MMHGALRASFIGLIGLALTAAQDPPVPEPDYPDPPPMVAERIIDGRFVLGDFAYLRGYFPDASREEKADYAKLVAWLDTCAEEGRERLDTELAQLGVSHEGGSLIGAANICQQVVKGGHFEAFASYEDVAKATRGARLVFNTLVQSVKRAEERTGPFASHDLGGDLHHRTLGDQMLRLAFRWGWTEASEPRAPQMTQQERIVFLALLNSEVLFVDHQNTQWLKQIVAERGWPTISSAGERGSNAAWLLTQHADLDPAFQLHALRLIEPLMAEGEVSRRNYAYLYDRVMLKLAGKQRFGTQMTCETGGRGPRPLEEPERVDELRSQVDLEPVAEYLEYFRTPCPS